MLLTTLALLSKSRECRSSFSLWSGFVIVLIWTSFKAELDQPDKHPQINKFKKKRSWVTWALTLPTHANQSDDHHGHHLICLYRSLRDLAEFSSLSWYCPWNNQPFRKSARISYEEGLLLWRRNISKFSKYYDTSIKFHYIKWAPLSQRLWGPINQ